MLSLAHTSVLQIRWRVTALELQVRLLQLAFKAGFDPNQLRVPAGSPDGGQWTKVGDGVAADDDRTTVAQAERPVGFPIDLFEEERRGGHTIATHVGRSPQSLLARVRGERYLNLFYTVTLKRDGSFPSVMAATKLVNAALARNQTVVEKVASGLSARELVTAVFASKTGVEAYRPSEHADPYLRDTYGVGVVIVHDPSTAKGYLVLTAYPRSD
jgi:Bacterial CdiA-CT RNAse A domain